MKNQARRKSSLINIQQEEGKQYTVEGNYNKKIMKKRSRTVDMVTTELKIEVDKNMMPETGAMFDVGNPLAVAGNDKTMQHISNSNVTTVLADTVYQAFQKP